MASPSLALLSALIAGAARPTRLMVRDGSPPFIGGIGALVGAVPERAPLEDGQELRLALQHLGCPPDRVWGLATHRPGALVENAWFEAFATRGVPTLELCLGGVFELARREGGGATVTIVSLDHEPAFAGAGLTALLTSDAALAERVRAFCLADTGSAGGILDATPRGLGDDEGALLTIVERAFARSEAEWAAEKKAPAKARGASHVWKRLFRSEPREEVPTTREEPALFPDPPPQGKNSWLARLAELEEKHHEAVERLNETVSSLQAERDQRRTEARAAIEEWRGRFDEAEARVAAEVARHREAVAALAESRRIKQGLEESLAEQGEREARLRVEWEESRARGEEQAAHLSREKEDLRQALDAANRAEENLRAQSRDEVSAVEKRLHRAQEQAAREAARTAESHAAALARLETDARALERGRDEALRRLAEALTERDREVALRSVAASEADKARLALLERVQQLEEDRIQGLARITQLENRAAELTSLHSTTAAERDDAAGRLRMSEEAHRELLLERERLRAAVTDGQARFDDAAETGRQEAERREAHHAALVTRLEKQVSQLVEQAKVAAQDHGREAAALTERIARLEEEREALRAKHEAEQARANRVEESHREARRLAEERNLAGQREQAAEISRLKTALSESQALRPRPRLGRPRAWKLATRRWWQT